MNNTPNANRTHIAIYGRRNSGKSTLINAITGEETSVVSQVAGTTTDTVARAIELHGIGATLFIDTPGFDDDGDLGKMRVERTVRTIERTDLAFVLCDSEEDLTQERAWFKRLKGRNIPTVPIISKVDMRGDTSSLESQVEHIFGEKPLLLSAKSGVDIELIREAILRAIPSEDNSPLITAGLVSAGDLVLLVMPQDIQAPKGRLILPQVQTLRELLDLGCMVMSCTTDMLTSTLASMSTHPKLIITDSQVFRTVYDHKPQESMLTSFSVLMAGYKGDIESFVRGASAIDSLNEESRVLIAEACNHAPLSEDIGRVKLPRMLRQRFGEGLRIDIVAGRNFPEDVTPYDLIIHCGGCMFNRKYILSRVERANRASTPITNYGVAIAHLSGILPQITLP